MKGIKVWFYVLICMITTSCATSKVSLNKVADFGYHPVDPLPVKVQNDAVGPITNIKILKAMPDETMRLAIGEYSAKSGVVYSSSTTGYQGHSYIVIVDYIKYNTESYPVKLDKAGASTIVSLLDGKNINPDAMVPVYVGVGLRLTVNLTVKHGKINLGNLLSIGSEAALGKVSGTLVVQTLGISGDNISSMVPIPSEINTTTIQNALLALGAIKAKVYDEKTTIVPRVVGVYNNLGNNDIINGFVSLLLQKPKPFIVPYN